MKKVRKSGAKSASKRNTQPRKKAVAAKSRVSRRRAAPRRGTAPRRAGNSGGKRPTKAVSRQHARSAAKMAASVMSRRAAKNEAAAARPILSERPPLKLEPRIPSSSRGKASKSGVSRSGGARGGSALPGSRPVVRVSKAPQFNYMKPPGADSGFDVGDTVEVYCDHELEGERVRGWVKGVVVQVDNKLVAVQFRSNVFLTDGWMVPDRILWYSLSSDQIRGTGVGKKVTRIAIPEY